MELSSNHYFYPTWLSAVWNTACLTTIHGQGRFKLNINGLTVLEIKDFSSNLFKKDKVKEENLSLLSWQRPHHGAITDVNIWDRILPEQEQSDWMFCKTETGGNVVSWESAQLNITGLNTDLVNREETCPGPQNITKIMAFNTKTDFLDSNRFCHKLGGHMAVAVDKETSDLMNQTFVDICPNNPSFFSGFTDSRGRGTT